MKRAKSWLERLMSHDRRRGQRYEARRLVAYYWDGAAPQGHRIRDISSSGFYLLTEQRWYVGSLITMTLQRAGSSGTGVERSIPVQARVIRVGVDGVGLEFLLQPRRDSRRLEDLPANGADKKTLQRFLRLLLADGIIGPGGKQLRESHAPGGRERKS